MNTVMHFLQTGNFLTTCINYRLFNDQFHVVNYLHSRNHNQSVKVYPSLCTPYRHMGSGDMAPFIPNLALDEGKWSALHPRAKRSRYLLTWRLDGPQSRPGHFGEENLFLLPGIEPQFLSCPARTTVPFSDGLDFSLTHVLQYKDNTKGVKNTGLTERVLQISISMSSFPQMTDRISSTAERKKGTRSEGDQGRKISLLT